MFGYITILPVIINVRKFLLHTGGGCLAIRQKWPNLPYLVHLNNCHGNQTFNNYLALCYNMKDLLMSLCVALFQFLSITK